VSPWKWIISGAWWNDLWSKLLSVDSDVWQIYGSVGTFLAIATSVAFAVDSGLRSRRDRGELIALRASEAAKERLVVAGRVAAWISDTYEPDSARDSYRRAVTLHVANESDEPVFNATTVVFLGDRNRMIGPLGTPSPISVVPPHRELTWDISSGLAAFPHNMNPLVQLAFSDSKDRRWLRDADGALTESTGKEVSHYPSQDVGRAEEQLGDLDFYRNPMSVAHAFAAQLWSDPAEFNLEFFIGLLDEEANGWKGEWDDARVENLRGVLSRYHNLATLAWYSTPKVAYARMFSDSALNQTTKAGNALVVEGIMITLVHHQRNGWRVFGLGADPYRPDQIKFPDGEFSSVPVA